MSPLQAAELARLLRPAIGDERVLAAVASIPRERFVPADLRVLDVGTGSGYHAALLSLLAAHVYTIERHRELSAVAEQAIRDLGIDNVTFVVGDGWDGLPNEAPFEAINVAAATGDAEPFALERQLTDGGRLVHP